MPINFPIPPSTLEVIADAPPFVPFGSQAADQGDSALYLTYLVSIRYESRRNILGLPVAVKDPATDAREVFVRTGSSQTRKVVSIECSRMGDWPELPRDDPFPAEGQVLLDYRREIVAPRPAQDGITMIYSVVAHYTYGLATAKAVDDYYEAPVTPWVAYPTYDSAAMSEQYYRDGLSVPPRAEGLP